MPRQRASFGCVQRMDKGKYRLRWAQDTPSGRKRCTETFYGTRREAERRMAEIRLSCDEMPAWTCGELWRNLELPHLERMLSEGRLSRRTVDAYKRRWESDVSARWADVPCTEVRPTDIQEWLLTMTKSMGELSRAVLSLVLDQAVMLEQIQANPCARRYELGHSTKREKVAYTPEQLDEIWDAVRGSVAEVPFLLSAHAGLRVGEACAVRREDMERRDDCVLVHVSVQVNQRGEVLDRLKTAGSRRTAVLPEPWASRVMELCGPSYANEQVDGTPIHPRTVADNWKRRLEAAGVPYQPMQVLRPSYQTNLHWAGVPIEQTSRLLGHSNTDTTITSYDRPSDEQLVAAALGRSLVGTLRTNRDTTN